MPSFDVVTSCVRHLSRSAGTWSGWGGTSHRWQAGVWALGLSHLLHRDYTLLRQLSSIAGLDERGKQAVETTWLGP